LGEQCVVIMGSSCRKEVRKFQDTYKEEEQGYKSFVLNHASLEYWNAKLEGIILLGVICLFQELLKALFTTEIIFLAFYVPFYGHLLCYVHSTYGVFDHFPIDGMSAWFSTLAPFPGTMGFKYLPKQKVGYEK
jgi:hypothetical protein